MNNRYQFIERCTPHLIFNVNSPFIESQPERGMACLIILNRRGTRIILNRRRTRHLGNLTELSSHRVLTQSEIDKIDAFHRKELRRVLNIIRYPVRISYKSLFKKCDEKHLYNFITERR